LAKISILKIPETVKSDQTKMRNAQPSLESPLNGGIYLKIPSLEGWRFAAGRVPLFFNFFIAYPWKRTKKIG
jgi:hypothetical protein